MAASCRVLAAQCGNGIIKSAPVQMLDEGDDIAASLAAAAIPNLLASVDRESVGAAALRAWSAALGPAAIQFDTAPRDFILNADSAGLRDPVATEQFVVSFSQIHATTLE
jgi:hypothetical protein